MKPAEATARARANIALAKYWGKSDESMNLPAVPSISVTLDPLVTETCVRFEPKLRADSLLLDGEPARERERQRVASLLDRIRRLAGGQLYARVESRNHFPTAAGLASSASGFAALAAAAARAAGLPLDFAQISALARSASASAARSVYGGFVELPAGMPGDTHLTARPLAPPEHWNLRVIVAVTAEGRKGVGSTDGMEHTKETSPYYPAWVATAPSWAGRVREALMTRDLPLLGEAMEQSTLAMHACALAAGPGLLYWQPATVAALHTVRQLREQDGVEVWATVDAGPHVKALCHANRAETVAAALAASPGVLRTLETRPGPGIEWVE
jgi:diphosphomevalonate decarboxylase